MKQYRLEIDFSTASDVSKILMYLKIKQAPLQVKLRESMGSITQRERILKTDGRWYPYDG